MTNYREEERTKKLNERLAQKHLKHIGLPFVNAKTDIRVKCLDCGTVFESYPELIRISKYPCKGCKLDKIHAEKKEKFERKLYAEMEELGMLEDYEVIEFPPTKRDAVRFIHKVCGNEVNSSFQNLVRYYNGNDRVGIDSKGCMYCAGNHTYTDEEVKAYLDAERPNYTLNKVFRKDRHQMVNVTHELCGVTRDLQYNYFMRGEGCKYCRMSGGEETIKYTLDNLGVDYMQEKSFNDLRSTVTNSSSLIYDFYLPNHNMLIEFDGRQHTQHITTWVAEDSYNRYVANDKTKNKYAVDNGITLIRIPYTYKGSNLMTLVNKLVEGDLGVINKYRITRSKIE